MARDFRPKEKKSKPAGGRDGASAGPRPQGPRASNGPAQPRTSSKSYNGPAQGKGKHVSFGEPSEKQQKSELDDGEEGNEEELREAIAALGGSADDFDLISGDGLTSKGKQDSNGADEVSGRYATDLDDWS